MKKLLFTVLSILTLAGCKEKTQKEEIERDTLDVKIDSTFQTAVKQYRYLSNQVTLGEYPKTFYKDKEGLETSNSGWWCSGFFPGTLFYLDEAVGAQDLKEEGVAILEDLKKEQFNTSTHDLGFMMYCSFGNAERLAPKKEYEEILMNSAKSLSTRYNDTVQAIRSWNSAPWNKAGEDDLVVIIDNMMNLELLF